MGPIWGLYCEINGSHMGPTCNLNMGAQMVFANGLVMGPVWALYMGHMWV